MIQKRRQKQEIRIKEVGQKDTASITQILLSGIKVAGIISVAVLAPNALQMLTLFGYGEKQKPYIRNTINNTLQRLIKQGDVVVEWQGNQRILSLSKKGEARLIQYELKRLSIEKPKKWDCKWRLVIFDIHENQKSRRNWLRQWLSQIGFIKLQNSVWVYPYECEEIITLFKVDARFGTNVLYIVADKVEGDQKLKRIFGLL